MKSHDPHPDTPAATLRRRLDGVDKRLATLDTLTADVAALGRGLAELTALVRGLTQTPGRATDDTAAEPDATEAGDSDEQEGHGQPNWLTVTDPELAALWLSDAAGFAADVLARFPDSRLPACWMLHPVAVTELVGLHLQYVDAYTAQEPGAVSELLGRWLPGAVVRLKRVTQQCEVRAGHVEGKHVYTVARLDPGRVALWWLDSRTSGLPASEAFCLTPIP